MKKLNFLYIILIVTSFTCFGFTIFETKNKQEDPKKIRQEDPKKVREEAKKTKLEESQKSKLEDLKNLKPDTIKISKVVTEEIQGDSLVVYKGKFMPFKKKTHASYYNDRFHGRRTASGKLYDKNKLTAAHKKLPFGTKVKVTNESNGKSVVVEVTDRGPFVKGREIDLSKKAFFSIASSSGAGYINVTLAVLQK